MELVGGESGIIGVYTVKFKIAVSDKLDKFPSFRLSVEISLDRDVMEVAGESLCLLSLSQSHS